MPNELAPISQSDFNEIINRSVTVSPLPTKTITNQEINNEIVLQTDKRTGTGVYIRRILFKDCVFNSEVSLGDYSAAGHIGFDGCVFNESLIATSFGKSGNCEINSNCEFKKHLILHIDRSSEALLSDFSIDGTLTILGRDRNKLSLNNINVNKQIKKHQIIIKGNFRELSIENIFFDSLNLKHLLVEDPLILNKITGNKLFLDNVGISHLQFKEAIIKEIRIEKNLNSGGLFNISENSSIGKLNLPLGKLNKIDISNSIVTNLTITDSNDKDSVLNIEKVTFKNLSFNKIYNNGLITLRQLTIEPKGLVSIKSSNLGKTDFINCDFSSAVLEFENSKLTEVFLSETDFPKEVTVNGIVNNSQAQLAFGQLNTAFQKQGDTIRALEYQAREIEAHYNNLKKWLSPKFPFLDFTKLNLFLNKWSNNFGRFWMRGVFFSIFAGLLFFYCLVISTDEYQIGFAIDFKPSFIPSFLKFMNPLRFFELDNIFKKDGVGQGLTLNGGSYLWDFIGRVFVAYGFYQTIQAFRRYGRK